MAIHSQVDNHWFSVFISNILGTKSQKPFDGIAYSSSFFWVMSCLRTLPFRFIVTLFYNLSKSYQFKSSFRFKINQILITFISSDLKKALNKSYDLSIQLAITEPNWLCMAGPLPSSCMPFGLEDIITFLSLAGTEHIYHFDMNSVIF